MAGFIYASCAFTAFLCALLLLRAYRLNRYQPLLWGGLCFAGLTVSNSILVLDKIVIPDTNLLTLRLSITLISMLVLLYGLIWNCE